MVPEILKSTDELLHGPSPEVHDGIAGTEGSFAWTLGDSAADTTGWYLEPHLTVTAPTV